MKKTFAHMVIMIYILSCGTPTENLIGKWKFIDAIHDQESIQVYNLDVIGSRVIEFLPNGELHHFNGDSRVGIGVDEYNLNGDSLTISSFDIMPEGKHPTGKSVVHCSINNDTLIIESETLKMTYVKVK